MTTCAVAPPQRTRTLPGDAADTADVALFDVVWPAVKFRLLVPGHTAPSANIAKNPAALGVTTARFVNTAETPSGTCTPPSVTATARSAPLVRGGSGTALELYARHGDC